MIVSILAIALVSVFPVNPGNVGAPVLPGGGGPDAYGYRYLDSDTTAPGAPTYNWVSIKGAGTRITSLGDDNVAGPFSIGFDFPYYWYRVNSVYVGSNGYITFGDPGLNASPFNGVPNIARTNNTLAMLMSDLECSSGGSPNGSVWYWTNTAADTFIVEYDSIRFWSTGGNNTFQVILSKRDSSITFQYKEQSGAPFQGWAPTSNQTGIENVSGSLGLNYLSGTIPPGNMYHTNLAVRFFPPDSTNYQVHDAGVKKAMNEKTAGFFGVNNRPQRFWGVFRNFGNQPEAAFKAYAKVARSTGSVVFFDSVNVRAMNPGEQDSLWFPNAYTPTTAGVYVLSIYTRMTGDVMPSNDSAKIEYRVVTMPATLGYDRGTPTAAMSWNGPGGFGNFFYPPVYPCSVSAIRIYAQSASSVTAALGLFDDNGPGGSPGDTLYIQNINVSAANWYSLTLPSPAVITEGGFFVGSMSETSSDPSYGMDSVPPLSYQGWEFTGVWAPGRDAPRQDVMANATVSGPVGLMELTPAPVRPRSGISVNPNPFGTLTTLKLENALGSETGVEIYDATGSVVRTVPVERGNARFDGRDAAGRMLPEGVYFARVCGTSSPVAKVIIAR
ncbi:MAG: hypothetical protein R6X13_11120 [bacterium]